MYLVRRGADRPPRICEAAKHLGCRFKYSAEDSGHYSTENESGWSVGCPQRSECRPLVR